jgi:hypothetical protein
VRSVHVHRPGDVRPCASWGVNASTRISRHSNFQGIGYARAAETGFEIGELSEKGNSLCMSQLPCCCPKYSRPHKGRKTL